MDVALGSILHFHLQIHSIFIILSHQSTCKQIIPMKKNKLPKEHAFDNVSCNSNRSNNYNAFDYASYGKDLEEDGSFVKEGGTSCCSCWRWILPSYFTSFWNNDNKTMMQSSTESSESKLEKWQTVSTALLPIYEDIVENIRSLCCCFSPVEDTYEDDDEEENNRFHSFWFSKFWT